MAEMSEKIIRYDLETEINHGIQVSNLAYKTGRQMSLAEDVCYELAVAGMLHDIGKLRLSPQNRFSRCHLRFVYDKVDLASDHHLRALKNKGYSSFVLEAVYYHHENFDGSGYPENLRGEEIPLGSRILRVCDTYAALTEKRPYRDAFDSQTAVRMMIDEVKNFDMQIFLAFQRVVHES